MHDRKITEDDLSVPQDVSNLETPDAMMLHAKLVFLENNVIILTHDLNMLARGVKQLACAVADMADFCERII